MTKTQAEVVARLLDQNHAAFAFLAEALQPSSRTRTVDEIVQKLKIPESQMVIFGFVAVAIVFSFDFIFRNEPDIPRSGPLHKLKISHIAPLKKTQRHDVIRHLRNSFAHGCFEPKKRGKIVTVIIKDFYKGQKTFQATCTAQVLAEIAEKLLIAAHKKALSQT